MRSNAVFAHSASFALIDACQWYATTRQGGKTQARRSKSIREGRTVELDRDGVPTTALKPTSLADDLAAEVPA